MFGPGPGIAGVKKFHLSILGPGIKLHISTQLPGYPPEYFQGLWGDRNTANFDVDYQDYCVASRNTTFFQSKKQYRQWPPLPPKMLV